MEQSQKDTGAQAVLLQIFYQEVAEADRLAGGVK